ncbi:MAG: VanZ family protein [Phycisphaeraceae bacterium]|nr:VanZ family protein [Phycisphaeraceae bacterium]
MRKKLTLISVIIYWPAIFFLTHTPLPKVVHQANLSDKHLHFMVYFILVFLLWGAIKPYSKVTWSKPTVWIILAVTVWYGVMDEWLQGFVHGRTADVHDFWADLAGTLTSLAILSILSFWPALITMSAMAVFVCVNSAKADITQLLPFTSTWLNPLIFSCFTGLTSYCVRTSRIPIFDTVKEEVRWLLPVLLSGTLLTLVKGGGYLLHRQLNSRDSLLSGLAVIVTVFIAQNSQKLLEICRK